MSASPRAPPACLIFDLDGTLYPNDNGYVAHIRQNAERYMTEQLGIPADEVSAVRRQALALANQTVRGLKMQGYEFDEAAFVENMRAGEELFMTPDAEVDALLASLPQRKVLFTNTGEAPARRALQLLGLQHHFEKVYGADFMGDVCKPQPKAFQMVLDDVGVAAHETVMFEDSLKNVRACKQLGMGTVFITGDDPEQGLGELSTEEEGGDETAQLAALADAVVSKCSLTQLKPALPSLWE